MNRLKIFNWNPEKPSFLEMLHTFLAFKLSSAEYDYALLSCNCCETLAHVTCFIL